MLTEVAKVFDDYFAMIVDANTLARERGKNDALQLIQLRRELSRRISGVQQVVDDIARAQGLQEASIAELKEHRAMFSAERRAIAGHQAKWNAPAMHLDRAEYERDCKALFKMHEENHRWRKHVLLPAIQTAISRPS